MRLNLNHIRTAHERIDKVYPPEAFAADEQYTVVAPVHLGFDIYKDKAQFRLRGQVTATLELPCSRCLEPFRWPVDERFELMYHPQSENTGAGEREVGEDDFSTAYYENDEIDLEQLIRERFLMSLPMKPLCTAECLGLCPSCGTNLNRGHCDCKAEWEDPRFEALRQFQGHGDHGVHGEHGATERTVGTERTDRTEPTGGPERPERTGRSTAETDHAARAATERSRSRR